MPLRVLWQCKQKHWTRPSSFLAVEPKRNQVQTLKGTTDPLQFWPPILLFSSSEWTIYLYIYISIYIYIIYIWLYMYIWTRNLEVPVRPSPTIWEIYRPASVCTSCRVPPFWASPSGRHRRCLRHPRYVWLLLRRPDHPGTSRRQSSHNEAFTAATSYQTCWTYLGHIWSCVVLQYVMFQDVPRYHITKHLETSSPRKPSEMSYTNLPSEKMSRRNWAKLWDIEADIEAI